MENVTQLHWSEDKYKNGDDIPKTLLNESEYINKIVPACNPDNSCEVIQDFLEEKTALHYSIWYFEYKEEKEKRILDIEKRLFEIKDEQLELKKELNIIHNELLTRLNESLK